MRGVPFVAINCNLTHQRVRAVPLPRKILSRHGRLLTHRCPACGRNVGVAW